MQFFYLRSEVGRGAVKTEEWREAATNTKSSVGKAQGKEEKMLERVKSTAVILCPCAFCPYICMLKRWLCAESTVPTVTFRS